MSVCLEIAIFTASEAYQTDCSILNPALEILSKADGIKSIYHGIQVEDGKTGYVINVWESIEHHMKFVSDPSFPEAIQKLAPAKVGNMNAFHVNFHKQPDTFDQPVTAVSLSTIKSPEANERVLELFGEIIELSKRTFYFGQTIESQKETSGDNVVWATSGWESVEAHSKIPKPPQAAEITSLASEVEVKHVKFTRFI